MTLGNIYKDLLENQIILGHLRDGEIPHKKQVDAEFLDLVEDNPNLDSPFTDPNQYTLAEYSGASASKLNKTLDNLILDLSVLYRSAVESGQISTDITDKALSELKILDKAVSDLDDTAASLLLLASDIEGFTQFIYDNFANSDKIDLENSTIFIDNNTQTVQLPILKYTRIPTNLSLNDVQFNVLSRTQLLSSQTEADADLLNALKDFNKPWIQKISYSQPPTELQAEYIVKFPRVSDISKIIIRPVGSDKGSIVNVVIQYSSDGINWLNVSGENNKRLITDTSFQFDITQALFWRFFFTKTGYDQFVGDSYIYNIGIKSFEFYGTEYEQNSQRVSEAIFYSLPQSTDNLDDINRVSLKTCELIPDGTSIDYQIAFMTEQDQQDYLNNLLELPDLIYSDIDPINRDFKTKPVIVDGAKVSRLQNFNSIYGLDSVTDHKYKSNINNVLIDSYTLTTSVLPEMIEVWRNLGDNTLDGGGNNPVKVNNVDNGWILDGDFYSCEFYISDPNGRVTDFGPNELEIDGLRSSGRISLANGKHRIRTHRKNWLSINPASISLPSDPNPDLLYPHNHKYLVEGLMNTLYGVDLTVDLGGGVTAKSIIDPDNIYISVEKYWGKTLKTVSLFDFAFKVEDNNYTVYTLVNDINGDTRVLIKYSTEPNLFTNEKFAIIEDQITGTLYKFVVLKAVFKSTKQASSPILDSYTIRLGL